MISNCSLDENGKISGGKAGDQTKGEFQIRGWYNKPWGCVLRHPDPQVRDFIASVAETLANNDNVGYDQSQRLTLNDELIKTGWHPELITSKCETDCSAAAAAEVRCAGFRLERKELQAIPADIWTGNQVEFFKKAGFEVLTDKKYLTSDKYLIRGDILHVHTAKSRHTATNLTDGSMTKVVEVKEEPVKVEPKPEPVVETPKFEPFTVKINVKDLNMRQKPTVNSKSNGYIPLGVYTIVETKDADGYTFGKLKSGAGWIALKYTTRV